MLLNAIYIQVCTFFVCEATQILGKNEHRENTGPQAKKFQATSATSGPTPDYMRTCSKNSEFSVYKYLPNLPSTSFLYNSHFP